MSPEYTQLFEAKSSYRYLSVGSRENIKSGIVKVQGGAGQTFTLGIKNPDDLHGINVAVECVAIVLEEQWGVREVRKPTVTSRTIPTLAN